MNYGTPKSCESEKDVNLALVEIRELNAELTKLEVAKRAAERKIGELENAIRIYVMKLKESKNT